MWREKNEIFLGGNLQGEPLPALAAIFNLIEKQGYRDVVLNFKSASFISAAYMMPIVMVCLRYRRLSGVDFNLKMPTNKRLAKVMLNTNWSHYMCGVYPKFDDLNLNNMSVMSFSDAKEHEKAVDKIVHTLLRVLRGATRSKMKALEWALNEITDNVLGHAQSRVGGLVQVLSYPSKSQVEMLVCDAGVTVQKSLRAGRLDISSDEDALRMSIMEGVTKNKKTNMGNGLYGTYKCCDVSGGDFSIISGNLTLSARHGEVHVGRHAVPYDGTMVRARIRMDYEELLENALVFGGRPHDPGFDYIEKKFQSEVQGTHIKMRDEATSFGSREIAKPVRNIIENLTNLDDEKLYVDFDGVDVISSSFADEVFGMLFISLGEKKFSQKISIINANDTVSGLIGRAISQRKAL
ncbi:STAS-like domain-containing protein [Caulobacter sp. BP25]|uniref:STAS-like domain-containing protein n=1 Tax=Caulobacter sp. BP25 TaxID=2048900 RepID=UPI000C12BE3C|nr:STAS-like domain-containing protein [Caulobacter sp. BP25]PHY21377.1 hypothetical protein CSW59_03900 [Caulobacter sp. BP25]